MHHQTTSVMAPNLSTLPVETLSLILCHFCLHCSQEHDYDSPDGYFRSTENDQQPDQPSWYSQDCRRTLHSMCLVARRLTPIAQPFLYHEFIPGYGDAWRSNGFSWAGRLASFLRTVAARPDLGVLVKRVFLHPYLLRAVSEEEAQATLEKVLGLQLPEYLASFDTSQQRRRRPKGKSLTGWKLVGALLALVPNLERLSIQVKDSGDVPATAFAALRTCNSPGFSGSVLSKLKTLDICPRSDGSWLCSLGHVDGVVETIAACEGSRLSTLPPSLQTLRLSNSRFSAIELAAMLCFPHTSELKSFFYEARAPLYIWQCVQNEECKPTRSPSSSTSSVKPQLTPLPT